MENKQIIKLIKQTTKLMELYGENDFKIRSYNSAIFNIEKANLRLADLSEDELSNIDGIGKSIAGSLNEIIQSGEYTYLNELTAKTPKGVLEMLQLSGFGPKKVKLIWEKLEIETLEELVEACKKDQIAQLKGFAKKTQEQLLEAAEFTISNRGKLHFREAEKLANDLKEQMAQMEGVGQVEVTAEVRRKMPVISAVEMLVVTDQKAAVIKYFKALPEFDIQAKLSGPLKLALQHNHYGIEVLIHFCKAEDFINELYRSSANPLHLSLSWKEGETIYDALKEQAFPSEEAIFQSLDIPFIPVELREGLWEQAMIEQDGIPQLVEMQDLKGIMHNHSTYSDGAHSLRQMAEYCKELGYEYLGISDHSKTAVYASGLTEDAVKKQHAEIDELNKELAPFKIFKGIESDILNDGSLDYSEEVLASFDFIVASIHAQLNMDEQKATERLIKAIANPYTTMLGHPTGRLLLKRKGYPINHKAVIDACAEHGVIIEINAHPWRLDLDWKHVRYALEKGVKISINPDAHEQKGYHDMYYGLCVGRKAGLTAKDTFNAFDKATVEAHFKARKERAKTI